MQRLSRRRHAAASAAAKKEDGGAGGGGTDGGSGDLELDEHEDFDDYLEMVIQFGYITLFASAFPLASALALACNGVERSARTSRSPEIAPGLDRGRARV